MSFRQPSDRSVWSVRKPTRQPEQPVKRQHATTHVSLTAADKPREVQAHVLNVAQVLLQVAQEPQLRNISHVLARKD